MTKTGAVLVRLPAARSMRNFRLVWAKEEEPCTNMTTAPLQECFSPLVPPHLKSAGQDVTGRLGKWGKSVVYPFAGHNHYNIVHLLSV